MRSFVLVAALAAGCGSAVAAELPRVDVALETGLSAPTDAALVIGIEEYPFLLDGAKQVPFAKADAKAFADWLLYTRGVSPSRLVKLIGAPSRDDIARAAREAASKVPPGGTVWVYFAGHGGARPKDDKRAILPADVRPSAVSVDAEAVSLEDLYGWIGGEVGQVIAVVDACYSGAGRLGGTVLSDGTRFAPSLDDRAPANVVEWVATAPGQLAQPLKPAGHGAFTYAVLGALRGWADGMRGDRDGQVTLEEAELYVARTLATLGVTGQDPEVKASDALRSAVLVRSPKLAAAPSELALREAVDRAVPPPPPAVVSPTVSGSSGFAMVDLDVSAALARQEAETEAQRQADAAQSGRLAAEVSRLQGEARTAWSKLGPQLEACAKLADAAQRAPCVAQAERFVAWAKGLVAEVSSGTETVTTKVGPLVRAVSARKETVVVPELAAAEAALAKVKAGPSAVVAPVAGGAAGSCGSWSGGQGCTVARIPKGTFTMGDAGISVTLTRDILLMTTEVTQGLYQAVTGANPSRFTSCGAKCPVEQVSWYDAVSFANALSVKDGLTPVYSISGTTVTPSWGANGWRLPTEAEWERAARGGQSTVYAGGNEVDAVAWHSGNSGSTTHAVCTKQPNAYGLCDMSGNVWEWVWDWYGSSLPGGTDPAGAASGSYRVNRGGGWDFDASYSRVAHRFYYSPGFRYYSLGFRLLRPVP